MFNKWTNSKSFEWKDTGENEKRVGDVTTKKGSGFHKCIAATSRWYRQIENGYREYINNSKLSNVKKLFHFTQKTAGDGLIKDGLTLAWKNRIDLYENKIIQIDKELKSFLS